MNDFKCVPIVDWPGTPTENRRPALFRARYSDTRKRLHYELDKLGATNIVLQVALDASGIRLDGRPRASARASHPGIILTFDTPSGPLSFPCDTFTDWDDNLRAIAMTLENLRAIDRYGVTKLGQQYSGWRRLPPAGHAMPAMSREAAAEVLARYTSEVSAAEIATSTSAQRFASREAYKRTHPDTLEGSDEAFIEVSRAIDVLEGRKP